MFDDQPAARQRDGHHARVGFVELFFDLVFVFGVPRISHTLLPHPTPLGALQAEAPGFLAPMTTPLDLAAMTRAVIADVAACGRRWRDGGDDCGGQSRDRSWAP